MQEFLSVVRGYDVVLGRRYLSEVFLNMDETPVWIDALPGYTLDVKGTKHINILTTGKQKINGSS